MLTIQTLGSLQITVDQHPLTKFRNKKAQALLVFLAVQAGQPFERKYIQALFWGNSDAVRAGNSLRQTLSLMRRVLPANILREDRRTIAFDASAEYQLDINQLATTPTLYTGQFLEGFDLKNADGWDEWLAVKREQLALIAINAFESAAKQAQSDRQASVAISHLQRVLAIDSWRESTHQLLMQAYALAGDRAGALAQFAICQAILRDELGVDVSPETRLLCEQIERGHTTEPHNLPPLDGTTRFIGRDNDLSALDRLLKQARLLTVIGIGGIGKTRLAIESARQHVADYSDGAWLVDLAGIEPGDQQSEAIAAAIAHTLGMRFAGNTSRAAQLITHLKRKQLLLLLDNYEHLLPDVQLIRAIVEQTNNVTLFVTSRQRLNLRVEQLYAVSGLAVPTHSAELQTTPSATLFINHAQRNQSSFCVTEHNADSIVSICRLLEGMPLGLEMAAAWTRLLDPAAIAAEIETNLNFLQTAQTDIPARQQSLETVFAYSWKQLSSVEQTMMQQLTIFRGPFDRVAYQAVTETSLLPLLALHDKMFIQRLPNNRFRLHARLRQFVQSRSAESPPDPLASQRYIAHYFNIIAAQADALRTGSHNAMGKAKQKLNAERDNILGAWHDAIEKHAWEQIAAILLTTAQWAELDGWIHGCRELFKRLRQQLNSAPSLDIEAQLMAAEARFLLLLGQAGQSVEVADKAIELCRQVDRPQALVTALAARAFVYGLQRNTASAEPLLADIRSIAQQLQQPSLRALALNIQGMMAFYAGDEAQALVHFTDMYQLTKQHGPERSAMVALIHISNMDDSMRDKSWIPEIEHLVRQLQAADESPQMIATAMHTLGTKQFKYGDFEQAKHWYLKEYQQNIEADGNRHSSTLVLRCLGELHLATGDYAQASADLTQALELAREVEEHSTVYYSLSQLGYLAHLERNHALAQHYLADSLTLAREHNSLWGVNQALLNLGRIAIEQGDLVSAQAHLTEALEAAQALNWQQELAITYIANAKLAVAQENERVAKQHLIQAAHIAQTYHFLPQQLDVLLIWGILDEQQAWIELAATHLSSYSYTKRFAQHVAQPSRIAPASLEQASAELAQRMFKFNHSTH